nr:OB-fold domain-containing protein [uncultured Rhodoferax sp.]
MTSSQPMTSPEITPETAAYWHAANAGRLLLRRCIRTGKAFHYPRTNSPFTGLPDTEWMDASGRGTIYSFSVSTRHGVPHCIAYITLDEGPTLLSNLVDCDFTTLAIGQRVALRFLPTANGQQVPVFTPSSEGLAPRQAD